jgi:hypothetical protein
MLMEQMNSDLAQYYEDQAAQAEGADGGGNFLVSNWQEQHEGLESLGELPEGGAGEKEDR